MADLLLTGRWVVLSSDDVRIDHAVLLRNGRVAEVGPTSDLRTRHSGTPERGGPECAILPGLINAHHHCYGVELANQAVDDDFLEPWMFNGPAMVGLSPYISTAHAALRLLRSGVTSVVDMCAAGSTREEAEDRLQSKAAAYRNLGIRAAIAPGERWENRIVHGAGEEAAFLATLPQDLRMRLLDQETNRARLSAEEYFVLMADLVPQGDGVQDYWFGPTGPQWTPDDMLRRIGSEAERLNTRIQTHALESHYESIESPRIRGCSVLEHLDHLGFLTPRTSLAHAVWATSSDIDLLSKRGSQISHNPGSNLRLRSGIAPVPNLVQKDVPTALGMDGTTLSGDEDMFAEMRLALSLGSPPHGSVSALTPRTVFAMATQQGARLMGRENELGQLRSGFNGDAIVLDLSRITAPWCDPSVDPISMIVARAKAEDVRDVVVAGQIVMQDHAPTRVDEPNLMARLREELTASPPDPKPRILQSQLRPYLMRWYAQWDDQSCDTHPPVTRYGARPLPYGKVQS